MTARAKSRRRSLGRMLGGGLVELAAVALLVALVSSGRLHRGVSESAEPTTATPIMEIDNPWETPRDVAGEPSPDDRSTIWSSLPDWRNGRWPSSGGASRGTDETRAERPTADPSWDDQDVERELTSSAEALRNWLERQAENALESLRRDVDGAREHRR